MRYGILADIHSNIAALEAVLRAERGVVDKWIFLGDAIGYGTRPVEVIRLLRKIKVPYWLLGNHDARLVGIIPKDLNFEISPETGRVEISKRDDCMARSLAYNRKTLEEADLQHWCQSKWTPSRMKAKHLKDGNIACWLVHGSLPLDNGNQQLTQYIFPWPVNDIDWGEENRKKLVKKRNPNKATRVLIHGHSHVPYARGVRKDSLEYRLHLLPINYQSSINLDDFDQLLICPGSVGQPRNPDPEPHAAYGILEVTDKKKEFFFHRVTYNPEPMIVEVNRLGFDPSGQPKMIQGYLRGANPEHEFWEINPIWKEWSKIYRLRDWGWEVI